MKNKMLKVFSIVLALTLLMLTFAGCNDDPQYEPDDTTESTSESTTESTTQAVAENVNPLTGKADLSDSAIGARPVAIMVENSPAARPQWGLSTPDIVIEGVVEGGVTRMMWIYADAEDIPKVGPTRSARHDYVEIADGMNAIFVHWGGSNLAYNYINKIDFDNIDGMKYTGKYFFRDSSRSSRGTEHTGYTNGENIRKAITNLKIDTKATDNNWVPFKVLGDGQRMPYGDGSGSCASITCTFSSGYKHTFKYNAEEKLYYNYMNSSEMKDGTTGKTMSVSNVIIMYCDTKVVDGEGHQDWNMEVSQGDAVFVSHGYGESISWKKDGKTGALKFYGKDGQILTINQGQTWIGIVPEANRSLTTITE